LSFWAVAGVAMLISSFWVDWFAIDFTYFKLNLGWFAIVYAGLLVLRNLFLKRELELTPRELHDWGEVLARVTPTILEKAEEGLRPRDIARLLKEKHQVPELVSLKFMVALARARKK